MDKVLVVDNDIDICQGISDVFKEEGFEVNIAHEGKEALGKLKAQSFDVMILDYNLSGISGLEVLEKTCQIRPSLQTVMISAYGDSFTKSRAHELGTYEFLDKPFDINELVKVVKRSLNGKKKRG